MLVSNATTMTQIAVHVVSHLSDTLYIVCSVYGCKVSIVQELAIVSWSLQCAEVLIGRLAYKVCLQ